MIIEFKVELDTEKEKDQVLIEKIIEIVEKYKDDFEEENIDKT